MGKSSFSMGHLYHGYVSHNQRLFGPSRSHRSLAPLRRWRPCTGVLGWSRSCWQPVGKSQKKNRSEVGAAVGNSSKLSRHVPKFDDGKIGSTVDFQKDSGGNCGKLICFRSFDKNKMHEFGNNDGIHHWHVQNRPSNSRTTCVLSSSTSLEIWGLWTLLFYRDTATYPSKTWYQTLIPLMILEPHRVVNPPYLGLSKYHIFDIQKGQILAAQSAFPMATSTNIYPTKKGSVHGTGKSPSSQGWFSHYKVVPQFVS